MSFMYPLLLLGALGVGLPILAHLLNKHDYKQTPWAAMQFLSRAVRVRSRQIRLRDLLLLFLRCLAVLLLVLAFSKPVVEDAEAKQARERAAMKPSPYATTPYEIFHGRLRQVRIRQN
jgi:hypothetical protein